MDAVKLLSKDHRTVEKLFREFRSGTQATKERCVRQLVQELSLHAEAEERSLYPQARQVAPDLVKESLAEHAKVKKMLAQLNAAALPDDLATKIEALEKDVSHHVEEEESGLFPKLQSELGKERLGEIGDQIQSFKSMSERRSRPSRAARGRRRRTSGRRREKAPKRKTASRRRRTKKAVSRKRSSQRRRRAG